MIKQAPAYKTNRGAAFIGDSRELLAELPDHSINLVVTSPPFALQRQKEYGNLDQHEYIDWFLGFARLVHTMKIFIGSTRPNCPAPSNGSTNASCA